MSKCLIFAIYFFVQILFFSCRTQLKSDKTCLTNFEKAKEISYKNPTDLCALDSALIILNRSIPCDTIRFAVVDLKMRLFLSLERYQEGLKFIDSLQVTDFSFPFKKNLYRQNLLALISASRQDTLTQDSIYKEMANDLETYIGNNNLAEKEFQEAFTELTSIPVVFPDTSRLNTLIRILVIKYPGQERFLDFFKD